MGGSMDDLIAVMMPGLGSSEKIQTNAEIILKELGIKHRNIVRVTEKFFSDCDPAAGIPADAQDRAAKWIDEQLEHARTSVDFDRVATLVGVAGTVTTVTAQALELTSYQPELIHAARLSPEQIDRAVRFMVDQPVPVKAALGFMPEGREDVIAAGALIWSRIVRRIDDEAAAQGRGLDEVITSEHDILDGIALSIA